MKRVFFLCFFIGCYNVVLSQRDSISIAAKLNDNNRTIVVEQEINYYNPLPQAIHQVKLLNWIAAYKNRHTDLLKRKVEDRKKDLYFAKENQLGACLDLQYAIGSSFISTNSSAETIYIPLEKPLEQGQNIKIKLRYRLVLPDASFTGYGWKANELSLKYFFLSPDSYEDISQKPSYYKDIEESANNGSYWRISIKLPKNWQLYSNLNKTNDQELEGVSVNDPEIIISPESYPRFNFTIEGEPITIQLAYNLSQDEKQRLEFLLPLQLNFLKSKLGKLPSKLLITEKFKKREGFLGINDIKVLHLNYQLFTDQEKTDLDYISILSTKVVDESFIADRIKDHWLKNGLKTYLEIEYVNRFYPDHKLLGDLPENAKFLGIKPLKLFNVSKLKLVERYGLGYHYISNQNLDQSISTDYDKLNNFNIMAISHFETGTLLEYLSKTMEPEVFDRFIKQYIATNYQQTTNGHDFLQQLEDVSQHQSDFLAEMMKEKHRINLKIKHIYKQDSTIVTTIKKNTDLVLPIKLDTENRAEEKTKFWDNIQTKEQRYTLPREDTYKITVNDHYSFPETNFRDNYIYTKGVFSNTKKLHFKLIKDVQNPEYNEIFVIPRLNFNAYDKILLGVTFNNNGFIERKFNYALTPYYSTGTGTITGSGSTSYSIMPTNSLFRTITFGLSGAYYHYDYDLAYKKFGAATIFNFRKEPRSAIGQNVFLSYYYYEKDLTPAMQLAKDYGKYNLWSLGYNYTDNSLIVEKRLGTNIQWMEDFKKISAEAFYRWEFAKDRKISLRLFAGYFIKNQAKNGFFDYGISRVSNYSFMYGLLGQSAVSGILSQQYILAEGGFRSMFDDTANKFITSANVDSHVWKMINAYADLGYYKNKNASSQVIWDTGIKLKIIPDFFEIYFPVVSSLGFEPGFKDYDRRIRYSITLNFSALVNNLRRGFF